MYEQFRRKPYRVMQHQIIPHISTNSSRTKKKKEKRKKNKENQPNSCCVFGNGVLRKIC